MDNPNYSSLRIRRQNSLPCPSPNSTLRRHATSVLLNSRRLGASKNSPYVGSFRHAPPTTFGSMAASDNAPTSAAAAVAGTQSVWVSPVFSSATVTGISANSLKNSPYVGWFRHAPPSIRSSSIKLEPMYDSFSSFSTLHSSYTENCLRTSLYVRKVDPDFLMKLDRWHQTLNMILQCHENEVIAGRNYTKNALWASSRDMQALPPFQDNITGRLVGGNGKDQRCSVHSHSSSILTYPQTISPAAKVFARITSWLLFPLVFEEDDVSLCRQRPAGLKLVGTYENNTETLEAEGNQHIDDRSSVATDSEREDDSSTTSDEDSCSTDSMFIRDLPAKGPSLRNPTVDATTRRELSEMNISVSEIAEAYIAHQMIDQERFYNSQNRESSRIKSHTRNQQRNPSGLLVSSNQDEFPSSVSSLDHRLDYEITQMDIARMARNASRHLDVDSILSLPTVTYQRRSVSRKGRDLKQRQQQHCCNVGTCSRPHSSHCHSSVKSPNQNDEWSFVMVSGGKSSVEEPIVPSNISDVQEDVCVICLEEYRHGDRLRVLPCDHSFHVGCIDRWLSGSHSHNECFTVGCPTCKKQPCVSKNDEDLVMSLYGDNDLGDDDQHMDGSLPSWAFSKIGSVMAMSHGL